MPEAVLFDLDGTLADTAPDLAGILAHLQLECGLTPTPFEVLRPQVSNGVRGLLGAGFGLTPDAPAYADLAQRFLTLYAASIYVETCLFPGISELLDSLAGRSICVVGGDTVARAKPFPDPLLHACKLAALDPVRCIYVGDDIRDIKAGKAAGMRTLAAAYGYLGSNEPIEAWAADAIINHPLEILSFIEKTDRVL